MLVVNVLLFHTLRFYWQEKDKKLFYKRIAGIGLLLFLPIIISLGIYSHYTEVGKPIEVVVLQPNIDPYEEKYSLTNEETITLLQELAEKKITPQTHFVLTPETVISQGVYHWTISLEEKKWPVCTLYWRNIPN